MVCNKVLLLLMLLCNKALLLLMLLLGLWNKDWQHLLLLLLLLLLCNKALLLLLLLLAGNRSRLCTNKPRVLAPSTPRQPSKHQLMVLCASWQSLYMATNKLQQATCCMCIHQS